MLKMSLLYSVIKSGSWVVSLSSLATVTCCQKFLFIFLINKLFKLCFYYLNIGMKKVLGAGKNKILGDKVESKMTVLVLWELSLQNFVNTFFDLHFLRLNFAPFGQAQPFRWQQDKDNKLLQIASNPNWLDVFPDINI